MDHWSGGSSRSTSCDGSQSSGELVQIKGLDDVVVRSEVEYADPIADFTSRRDHDHGDLVA